MKLNADRLIRMALEEDITSEDITTNSVMRKKQMGEVQLLCKVRAPSGDGANRLWVRARLRHPARRHGVHGGARRA